ncbi:flavodoxin family protein [Candidatus Methanocrinis natronophilus]|uniref:NAD(P)H-dependent oxidoreductase n=1 Tax=Candidatus Methanocrinis natronophilus TaxID=3033396 RepID=A0ABT5X790_9EURY|nr:NAD(P)H-dependent oxidoreductase [Candidatus Methanocrinis natronophilus]MDF0590570.1 NAD(P)H-dependent oxidoreductase [Candidatus Methanocrinis natronophilus]
MTKVLVVYHSRSGNTARMAQAVAEGAKSGGAEVVVKKVEEAALEDLTGADGIVLGAPTYFGTLSAEMKGFIDGSVRVRGKLENKVGAAFTSSGSPTGGNETTLLSLIQGMLIHGMVIVGDPLETGGHYGAVAVGAPDAGVLIACQKLGERVGKLAKVVGGA